MRSVKEKHMFFCLNLTEGFLSCPRLFQDKANGSVSRSYSDGPAITIGDAGSTGSGNGGPPGGAKAQGQWNNQLEFIIL